MKNLFFILLFSLSFVASINAQNDKHSLFTERVLGVWAGTGQLFGTPASFSMKWNYTLNKKFLKLQFTNSFRDKKGNTRSLSSEAFYNLSTKKGYWFDSRGVMFPLELTIINSSMVVLWGDEKSPERGKTIYTIENNTCSVEDFVFRNDNYLNFGKATYEK